MAPSGNWPDAWGMAESTSSNGIPRVACVVADEDPDALCATVALLESAGIELLAATPSGIAALDILQARPATVVVLDARLLDLNGLDVARRVAEISRTKTQVILYTSDASPELVPRALDAGASGVVVKRSSPSNLLEAIAEVAGGGIYVDPELRGELRAAV
jgi:two-component system response regulator DesR